MSGALHPAPGGTGLLGEKGADPKALFARAKSAVQRVIQGKDDVVELALVAVVAGGHVLIQDVPGVGKTTLAQTIAKVLGGEFRRIQFTSDTLPGDITGVGILDGERGDFSFRQGPIFANVVLADEINRATPKTQSALLEAMNERKVTVDGVSHPLPSPFVVLATQNPHDFHGTFALPDSQLDRFLMRLSMGYPDRESERTILRSHGMRRTDVEQVLTLEEVHELIEAAEAVKVHEDLENYILALVEKTRGDERLLRGVSTRGADALYRACRALALARGRTYAIPEDVRDLAVPVLAHRVMARTDGGSVSREGAGRTIREILWDLPAPS